MKITKITSVLFLVTLLSASSFVYVSADVEKNEKTEIKSEYKEKKSELKSEYKMKKTEMKMYNKSDMKDVREKNIEMKKMNREKNMEEIRPYLEALPKDIQSKIEELREEKMAEKEEMMKFKIGERNNRIAELKEKSKNLSKEERKELFKEYREKMKEKAEKYKAEKKDKLEAHFDEIKSIVGDSEEAKAFLAKAKELHSDMKEGKYEKMSKMNQKRENYSEGKKEMKEVYKTKRADLRWKYKKAFAKKLSNRLDKIPTEKLEKILVIIDRKISETEAKTSLSDDRKEKRIAQYEALKDLINEKLNKSDDLIDINELLK